MERDKRLDIIRSIAIILVVWIHCMETFMFNSRIATIARLAYLFGRFGVPFFLMITGALVVNKDNTNYIKYSINKTLRLYIIAVVWMFIYRLVLNKDCGYIENLFKSLRLESSAVHTWYLSMIVFLYAIIPVLTVIKTWKTKDIILLVTILFLSKWINMFFYVFTSMGDYIIYIAFVITGYLIYNREIYKKINLLIQLVFILILIFGFGLLMVPNTQYIAFYADRGLDVWWYSSIFVVILSVVMFSCILKILDIVKIKSNIFEVISKASFGIYLIHYMVMLAVAKIMNQYLLIREGTFIRTFVLFLTSFVISTLLSYIIGKMKGLRYLVWR